jgi:hypothetical protein
MVAFLRVLWGVAAVIKPRGARHTPANPGVELIWVDHVLAHGSAESYHGALRVASNQSLLGSLSHQIYELASILKEKLDHVSRVRVSMWWAFGAWLIMLVFGLLLLGLQ